MNEELCPKCLGVPCAPEVPECKGCMECDFTGTKEAYDAAQKAMQEAFEAENAYIKAGICDYCGAKSADEAEKKCRPAQDESGDYHCPGDRLWEEKP